MFNLILKIHFLFFLLLSCSSNGGFYIYDLNGKEINYNSNRRNYNFNENITLYFDRSEIKKDYIEVNVIGSKHHYYGNFYFDKSFMNSLNKMVSLLDVDALIFEADFSMHENYNKEFIYFTAIQYKN